MSLSKSWKGCIGLTAAVTAAAGALWLWMSGGAAAAEQEARLVVSRPASVLEVIRRISRQQNVVVAAEVTDEPVLMTTVPPRTYPLKSLLDTVQTHLRAEGYQRTQEGALYFESSGASYPKPEIPSNGVLERRLNTAKQINEFLDSLTPRQQAELRANGFQIAATSLDPKQQTLLRAFGAGLGTSVRGVPLLENPETRIELRFRTFMTLWKKNDGSWMTPIGDTTATRSGGLRP